MDHKYKELIELIIEKIDSEKDVKFIKKHINKITKYFIEIQNTIKLIRNILFEKSSIKMKISKIKKLGFNETKSNFLFKNLVKNMVGGASENEDLSLQNEIDKQVDKIPDMILEIPKYILNLLLKNLDIYDNYRDSNYSLDFKKNLDITYLFLFITASVPLLGVIPDFITIVRAYHEKLYFLAISTMITRFLSFFTLNMQDLGLAFKIFYFLDNYSYTHYSKLQIK